MPYIADNYVTINNELYNPGERIPDGLPEDTVRWFLEAGAVHGEASAPAAENPPDEKPEGREEAEPPGKPGDAPDGEPEDEADGAVPEINVMEGLVQGAEETPEKPAKKPERRAADPKGKKTGKGGTEK